MIFTDLNLEQSAARYLADQLLANNYSVYWWDTKQVEGSGSRTVTLVREFPSDPTYIVSDTEAQEDHLIRVPAFSVSTFRPPTANKRDRSGIGESVFTWRAGLRIDGFAGNEKEWYDLRARFREWFNPDTRIVLRDYHADLTNSNPPVAANFIELEDIDLLKDEDVNAVPASTRYYLVMQATATYTE